jgi:hypothetical protein
MEKEVIEEIKEQKRKEKVDKRAKGVVDSLNIIEKTTQRLVEKHVKTNFNLT